MTQSERTAYNNGFAIGMTIGINARKDPFKVLYAAKLLEATTGEMPVLYADAPVSIENVSDVATGDTLCETLDIPVFFGTTLYLEEI